MKKPYIVGVCGQAGAGKDTFAAAFLASLAELGSKGSKYSFADPLKQACDVLFGGDALDHWYTQPGKACPFPYWAAKLGAKYGSGRNILVTIGTDVYRYHVNQNFWLMVAEWRMQHTDADVIIVPDVRFDNEAKWIQDMGGVVLHVVNTNQKQLRCAGFIVRRLRKVPCLGTATWFSKLLVALGYASHPSEDGISASLITCKYHCDSAEETRRVGSGAARTALAEIVK